MPLTEPQIRRYARHILLPEVGGIGQERLLATTARVQGPRPMAELARAYLVAAGVTCSEVVEAPALELLLSDGRGVMATQTSDPTSTIWVVASRCAECRGPSTGIGPSEALGLAASVAASELLLLALDLPTERRWTVSLTHLQCEPLPACSHR
jgi:hypothetical protein